MPPLRTLADNKPMALAAAAMLLLALSGTAMAQQTGISAPSITTVKPLSGGADISFTPGTAADGITITNYVIDCIQGAGTIDQQTSTSEQGDAWLHWSS